MKLDAHSIRRAAPQLRGFCTLKNLASDTSWLVKRLAIAPNTLEGKGMIYRWGTILVAVGTLAWFPSQADAALVIQAENAAIRTEGGPNPGGGWNLWSNGRVGQAVRIATSGSYEIDVQAWGSPAAGVWPEMALLVDGREVNKVTVGGAQRVKYHFDVELAAGIHEIAAAFLNDAVIGKEDRNLYLDRFKISPPSGAVEPILINKRDVSEAAEKSERDIVAVTQSSIEKYRKADATIRIVDAADQAIPGVKVSIEQTAHEFLFGCNIYGFDHLANESQNAAYKERFAGLFNYATVGFYWRWYEP
jgi:Ca-dependent carbohydrate-binding module xylan-binding